LFPAGFGSARGGGAQSVDRPAHASVGVGRFRTAAPRRALRHKEWVLLARDPG